jgi:VIT1/CCC1 family predicted Fe2+/Mn2+ transporter
VNRPRDLQSEHTAQAISKRLARGPATSVLRDLVYGAIDGTVTTFAVVAGVVGAGLRPAIILILGIANLAADGFSMAASNFLATRAEIQRRARTLHDEERQITVVPEGEREEIRQIYRSKGFSGEDLERAVEIITSDRKRWIDTMLLEEHGYGSTGAEPLRAGLATFSAFVIVGSIPLLSFSYAWFVPDALPSAFRWSSVLTGVAFFVVGALKSRVVDQRWWRSGAETLAVGGIAAAAAFGIGSLLGGIS